IRDFHVTGVQTCALPISDRALKFIQTGNEAELAGTGIGTAKHLREMTDLLLRLSGQDKAGSNVTVNVAPSAPAKTTVIEAEVLRSEVRRVGVGCRSSTVR